MDGGWEWLPKEFQYEALWLALPDPFSHQRVATENCYLYDMLSIVFLCVSMTGGTGIPRWCPCGDAHGAGF